MEISPHGLQPCTPLRESSWSFLAYCIPLPSISAFFSHAPTQNRARFALSFFFFFFF